MNSKHDAIMRFINENFIAGRSDVTLAPDQSLLESGIIDSTGVMELVSFLEQEYSVKIENEELVPENLDGINNIVKFLATKGIR